MTREYLEQMKADLLTTYAADLCEESLEDIHAATTLEQFIDILNKYTAFLKYKSIPKIDWVRKWFGGYLEEAEKYGCYVDCTRIVVNPERPITLYGNARVTLSVEKPHIYQVTTQDNSHLRICAYGICSVNVRQKDESDCEVYYKDNLSKIKIRKV